MGQKAMKLNGEKSVIDYLQKIFNFFENLCIYFKMFL